MNQIANVALLCFAGRSNEGGGRQSAKLTFLVLKTLSFVMISTVGESKIMLKKDTFFLLC